MTFDRKHAAVLLGVYATLALDAFGSVTSSPQTTELFARDRKGTLLKYVYIADAVGLTIGAAASVVDGSPWPFVGTAAVCGVMHGLYVHAAKVGVSQPPPVTPSQEANGASRQGERARHRHRGQ